MHGAARAAGAVAWQCAPVARGVQIHEPSVRRLASSGRARRVVNCVCYSASQLPGNFRMGRPDGP
eukprot:4506727-Alexandrium_andersonii.AAC.1